MFARVAFLIAVMALAPAARADEAMSSKDIRKLAPGTFHAVVKGKWQVVVTLTRDGTITSRVLGFTEKGRWSVRGDQLCITMPSLTKGQSVCSEVVADSGWFRGRNVAFRPL